MKKVMISISVVALLAGLLMTDAFAFKLGGKKLIRNGTGSRTKVFLTVYYCSLYVPEELKGKSAKEILEADQPMAIIINVDTKFLSSEKFNSAIKEGFGKAASAGYKTDKQQKFMGFFKKIEIVKGDRVYLNYVPGAGLTVQYKVGKTKKTLTLGTVSGLAFKKALLAIWLGPDPVQSSLKEAMLGK